MVAMTLGASLNRRANAGPAAAGLRAGAAQTRGAAVNLAGRLETSEPNVPIFAASRQILSLCGTNPRP